MRLIGLTLLLAVQTACMSLDGMVLPGDPLESYALQSDVIDAGLLEEVSFPSGDGATLYGVWAHQAEPKPPLIWFHGNGASFDNDLERVEFYWAWGRYDVFAVDYRGYGKSEGPAERDGLLEEDGLATVQYVSEATGVAPETIPVVALSLGAAVSAHTFDEIGALGVVFESMFPSTDQLLDDGSGLDLPTGWFFEDEFNNLDAIAEVDVPVFVIHGLADDFIDGRYGDDVFAAAPEPKRLWQPPNVGHSDSITLEPEAYTSRVLAFFDDPENLAADAEAAE